MTSNDSVYSVPVGNSKGLVMSLSFMVIKVHGSSSLMVIDICRCLPEGLRNYLTQNYRIQQ